MPKFEVIKCIVLCNCFELDAVQLDGVQRSFPWPKARHARTDHMSTRQDVSHVWTLVGHFPIPCLDLRPNMDLNVRRVFQKCKTVNTYIDGNLTGSSSTEIATIMLRWKIEEQRRQELIQKSKPRPSQPSPSQKVYDMLCEMDLKEKAQKTEQPVEQQLGPISNFSFEWDSDEEKDQLQYMHELEEAKWLNEIRKQDEMLTQQWAMEDFESKQSNFTKVPKPKKRRPNQRERLRWRKNMDKLKLEQLELAEISKKWSRNPKRPKQAEKSHPSAAKVRRYVDLPYSGRHEVDENGVLALHTI